MAERAGISDGFVYAPKPAAAPAANIRVSLPPHNKDRFDYGNETIMFNIPCGKRGQYLNTRMSYMTFDLDVTLLAGSDYPVLELDGGAHAFIQSLELYHGTNLLEQIREYNNLYSVMLDMQENETGDRVRNVSEGTSKVITPIILTDEAKVRRNRINNAIHATVDGVTVQRRTAQSKADDALLPVYGDVPVHDDNTRLDSIFREDVIPVPGLMEAHQVTTVAVASFGSVEVGKVVTYTFAIPIMSGVIGGGMGKYIPVGALQSDLRLEIGLAPWAQALRTIAYVTPDGELSTNPHDIYETRSTVLAKTHRITMRNVELQLEYIEVASDVQSAIEASTGGQYIMSFESFFNIQNAVPANAGSFTQLIGAKFSSVKTILSTFRDGLAQAYHHLSGLSRVNPFSTLPNRPEFNVGKSLKYPYGVTLDWYNKSQYENGSGWYYSIGATHYPPKPIRSDEESWYEALKSQHLIAVQQMPGRINPRSWAVSARRDTTSDSMLDPSNNWMQHPMHDGKFFMAQNFESQSHKSHLAESGVNTLAQNMYMHARFPPSGTPLGPLVYPFGPETCRTYLPVETGMSSTDDDTDVVTTTRQRWQQSNQQLVVDHYVHYDGLLLIVNGIANTRF